MPTESLKKLKREIEMDRDSFVMHRNFLEGIPEQEQFKWFKCICSYAFNNVDPKFDSWLEEKIWIHIKDRIESDREAYDKRVEYQKRYYERKKGKNNSTVENIENVDNIENVENFDNVYLDTRRNTVSDSVSVSEFKSDSVSEYESVSVSVSDSEFKKRVGLSSESPLSPAPKKTKRFVKPTEEDIKSYMSEKGYTFDSSAFYNFYESNGWKVGKNPMKDWKAACKTWQQRDNSSGKKGRIASDEEVNLEEYPWAVPLPTAPKEESW